MIRDNIADPNVCNIHGTYQGISWSAIIIGALVGTGLGFLLNLFGVAIGLSAFSAPTEGGAMTFALGGFLGLLIAVIVGMLAAGYTAGYLGRWCCPNKNLGVIYGFATWTLALILSAILAGSVSHYIGAYANSAANKVLSNNNTSLVGPSVEANSNQNASQTKPKTDAAVGKQLNPDSTNPLHLSDAAWMTFIAFVLFFIGALASCIGAVCAMGCRKREDVV